jgi:hypothetical protein
LRNLPLVRQIPSRGYDDLSVRRLPALSNLPDGLELTQLSIEDCGSLTTLPPKTRVVDSVTVDNCPVASLPDDLRCYSFSGSRLTQLRHLPAGWRTLHLLRLQGCSALETLPEGLHLVGHLHLEGCRALRTLPPSLRVLGTIDVRGCTALRELPANMPPPAHLEVAWSGLRTLPRGWELVRLTWNRVAISPRLVTDPGSYTLSEILAEPNVEIRRVLVERCGMPRLLASARPDVLDRDIDAGGPRVLLRLEMGAGEEPLLCLHVRCPSTGREYHLRVPPHVTTCRQGAAWLAGYDSSRYAPVLET